MTPRPWSRELALCDLAETIGAIIRSQGKSVEATRRYLDYLVIILREMLSDVDGGVGRDGAVVAELAEIIIADWEDTILRVFRIRVPLFGQEMTGSSCEGNIGDVELLLNVEEV